MSPGLAPSTAIGPVAALTPFGYRGEAILVCLYRAVETVYCFDRERFTVLRYVHRVHLRSELVHVAVSV